MRALINLYNRRIRGFRVVHVAGVACLAGLVLAVYLTKTSAGREAADIAAINRQIVTEERRLRLLRAELAYLEQPERLDRLSTRYLSLEPIPAQRETAPEGLAELARRAQGPGAGR